jgi:FkbM family methyltransferase
VLRRVIDILRLENVEVIPIGFSDHSGAVDFNLPVQFNGAPIAGLAHLATRRAPPAGLSAPVRFDRRRLVRCEVAPVDSMVSPELDISVVKVDVEGAELAVLRGGVKALARCAPTVICEVNPSLMEGFGYDIATLRRFMEELGYQTYWYGDSKLVSAISESQLPPNNWVFVHDRRRSKLAAIIAA